jgi:hypothetical protein
MSEKILRGKSAPTKVPNRPISSRKSPPLADAAATLLPGLQQAADSSSQSRGADPRKPGKCEPHSAIR